MATLFNEVFYRPMLNFLISLYHYLPVHDLGIAIIGLTIVTLFILFWPSLLQIRSSQALQEIQPKLKELQEKYKDNKQELAQQTMALYKEHKFNPFSSCLPLIIQLPFILAMYRVFMNGLKVDAATHLLDKGQLPNLYGHLRDLYSTTQISTLSFGFLDLTAKHNIYLALIVGISQYFLARLLSPKKAAEKAGETRKEENTMTQAMQQMNYITPFTFALFSYLLPAGISLYYITWNIFQILQRQWFARRHKAQQEAAA